VLKYLNESNDLALTTGTSDTDYLVFRYGETLLNFAEAAFELGKIDESLNALNQFGPEQELRLYQTLTGRNST
jgi:hypothetical protein